MIKLNNIIYTLNGRQINYDYTSIGIANKFLKENDKIFAEYSVPIDKNPYSINVIPFISNILPIAWFVGFDVYVEEIDADFLSALNELKKQFEIEWPDNKLEGKIITQRVIKNIINSSGDEIVFFSGGVDGYASLIRNLNEYTNIFTVLGADVDIEDIKQWEKVQEHRLSEKIVRSLPFYQVTSNLRTFYYKDINKIIRGSWWGQVQHGMALLGSCAPITFALNSTKVIIASSYTKEINISWGSSPFIDEKVKWANITVTHDGYELKRQDKIDLITKYKKEQQIDINIRVCYSELNQHLNCSNCEKCYRTILGIILANTDPREFGFEVDKNIYNKIFSYINSCGTSLGMRYFWTELSTKANECKDFFIFEDKKVEQEYINRIAKGHIDKKLEKISRESKVQSYFRKLPFRIKRKLQNGFK